MVVSLMRIIRILKSHSELLQPLYIILVAWLGQKFSIKDFAY